MIQLRSEETGIVLVATIAEALAQAKKDPSIWKISFDSSTGERIRLVRKNDEFVLSQLPLEY